MMPLTEPERMLAEADERLDEADDADERCDRNEQREPETYEKAARDILAGFSRGDVSGIEPPPHGFLTARFRLSEITSECLDVLAWVLFAEWTRLKGVAACRDDHYRGFVEDMVGRLLRVHKYSGMHEQYNEDKGADYHSGDSK